MKIRIKTLALCAVLTALALALSLLESTIPLGLIVPLPGVKLGLANVVTLCALFSLGFWPALAVLLCRILLLFLMTGSFTGFLMSLGGGLTAFLSMAACKKGYPGFFSLYGVSVCGACMHSVGQVAMALILTQSPGVVYYLSPLLLTSGACGILTAAAAQGALRAFRHRVE